MPAVSTKPRVVVVGGSFAGLCTARHLKTTCDVVVVEPRDYFEYTPGALHLMAGSDAYSALLSPMSQVARGCRHEQGWFLGIRSGVRRAVVRARKENGDEEIRELDFDALVLCNGVAYPSPIRASASAGSLEERVKELNDQKLTFETSDNIFIVGGGLVGVELAAELAVRLRHKPKITLMSRGALLNTLPARAGVIAQSWLKSHGVNLLIGEEVKEHSKESRVVRTKGGLEIPADLLMDCTGVGPRPGVSTPNLGRVRSGGGAGEEDVVWPYSDDGLVRVDESLEALQFQKAGVFAAGDVVEHCGGGGVGFASSTEKAPWGTKSTRPTVRNAHLAESQAELCAANVRRFIAARDAARVVGGSGGDDINAMLPLVSPVAYLRYPQDAFYGAPLNPLLSCVSLGPRHAIVCFNGVVIGGGLLGVLGMMAAVAKFIIERTKISEARQQPFGRAFWALGHVAVNTIHAGWAMLWTRPRTWLMERRRGAARPAF